MYLIKRSWVNGLLPLLFALILITVAALLLAAPVWAQATDVADQPDTPVVTGLPLGIIVVSFGMTALGYLLNYLLPFLKTDPQKGIATAVYQAVGVTVFELATSSDFGLNQQTLVAFVTAMGVWAFSHGLIYKPTGWACKLKAGQNKQDVQHVTPVVMARQPTLGLSNGPQSYDDGRWV
jgi:hypothetical protein